ncbi:MAG: hypothetical protein CVV27_13020 [Candidatus Melainabacteria bacterium HGW-Melainabacteria-1]|nr:MAG: hypothetical protein CVV27_13020 [Candidatus Melainabacteria bacterium HGW-Melainabacteria-1]
MNQLEPDVPQLSDAGRATAWLDLFERVQAPSGNELDWASERMAQPSPLDALENTRLQAIIRDFVASRRDLPAPSLPELDWALALAERNRQGQAPDSGESARLRDITVRLLLAQSREFEVQLKLIPPPTAPPSEAERAWGKEIYCAVLKGKAPDKSDYRRFLQLFKACQLYGPPLFDDIP